MNERTPMKCKSLQSGWPVSVSRFEPWTSRICSSGDNDPNVKLGHATTFQKEGQIWHTAHPCLLAIQFYKLSFSLLQTSSTPSLNKRPVTHYIISFITHFSVLLPPSCLYFSGTEWQIRSAPCILALRYKPEGRGIDSRLCHWNFSLT
jgi:hypothetical protein